MPTPEGKGDFKRRRTGAGAGARTGAGATPASSGAASDGARADGARADGGQAGCGGAAFRTRRLLETYFDLTLQLQDHLGIDDPSDVLMLVLIGIADLRGAPMDAELLAEKLLSSRSTVERRLRAYLDSGRVLKERRGKSVVYLLAFDGPPGQQSDMSVGMVRSVMAMVLDISND